jgi:hypothetical protein
VNESFAFLTLTGNNYFNRADVSIYAFLTQTRLPQQISPQNLFLFSFLELLNSKRKVSAFGTVVKATKNPGNFLPY